MSTLHWHDDQGPASGQKVLLATTAYDSPDASYTASIARSRAALAEAGVASAYALLSGNCHVDDSRNSVVAHFLKSDCTDLVFIDADVSWSPEALVRLCQHRNVDVVGGVYPKRTKDADEMPVRMLPGEQTRGDGLLLVEGLPTGFMRIRRAVLEKMQDASHTYYVGNDATLDIPMMFERGFMHDYKRLGGDIGFCRRAMALGFDIHADTEITLGHTGKVTFTDSLGAWMRRQSGETLAHVARKVGAGQWTADDITEALEAVDNKWGANADALFAALSVLKDKPGPVLEAGSGLSTVLMAAAVRGAGHYVYALEHDPVYAELTRRLAKAAGVKNIGLVEAPIDPETNWYSIKAAEGMRDKRFVLGFCDGPPRAYGSRTKFIQHSAPLCDCIVVDDMGDPAYQRAWLDYADRRSREIAIQGRIAVVR